MSVASIERLKKEQADLRRKLADEEARYAAKLGAKIIKALGLEMAEAACDLIGEKAKHAGPQTLLAALRAIPVETPTQPSAAPSHPGGHDTTFR